MSAVEIEGLYFSYGDNLVLENASLSIGEAEFFGIIGPNAAGKTTLLKLILGLLEPDRGRISVLGVSPLKARRRLGYVPQYPAFRRDFPITVREVVGLGRLGADSAVARDGSAMEQAMDSLELGDIAGSRIATLSGGQMQRMLIARALAADPGILILDEPTANIDMRGEKNIFGLLKRHNAHMTIIVVSHDVGFISAYVQRVACVNRSLTCMKPGEIGAGTLETLYGEPVTALPAPRL